MEFRTYCINSNINNIKNWYCVLKETSDHSQSVSAGSTHIPLTYKWLGVYGAYQYWYLLLILIFSNNKNTEIGILESKLVVFRIQKKIETVRIHKSPSRMSYLKYIKATIPYYLPGPE